MSRRRRRPGKGRPRRAAESLADAALGELIDYVILWPFRLLGRLVLRSLDAVNPF